uniref:HRDC domain-containing protein n=1 Tax=Eptatretus burgeri TaxID=7764 RepID=A0A8C4NJ32_EPTBU
MKDEEEPHPELFVHPYKYEVEQLEMPAHLLEAPTQKPPDPMEDGGCEIVQDPEKLQAVLDDLMKYKEIAVDLEHHSYRSYLGFTCLIQLSTPDNDYILDALVLRGHLHLLNQAFTHPGILKVFHGASMDVIWLQRDFGVYVVSMWDTAEGSRLLTGRRAGLRHLLLQYCDVSADKRYQLADWRIRPLPDEMVRYARQDTHYLLYIALRQRQDLLDRGGVSFIRQAWSLSKAVTLKHYEKPLYSEEVFEDFLNSRERGFTPNPRNITAMRLLHAWRDNVARVEDESTGYVLPNHMLLKISRELPKTVQGVLACCVPPPPLLCRHLADVHTLVLQARNSPEASAQQGANGKPEHSEKPANDNVVYCTQLCDEQTAASSLLAIERAVESVPITQPVISLFEESDPQMGKGAKRKQRALEIEQSFSNPFMLFLPSIAAKVLVPCPGGLVDQTTQSFAMLQKWKLLDATPTPEKLPKKRSAETPKVVDSSGKEGRSRSIKEQIHGSSTQNDGEIKKKKKKKTLNQAPEPIQLHQYDYSQSDFSIFNTPATGKKKDFDPTRETREKAKGTREKSKETREMSSSTLALQKRIAPRRQFEPRGVSYVQGKYARDTAHRWPRR